MKRGHREFGTGEGHCTVEDERAQRIRNGGGALYSGGREGTEI